MRRLIVVLALSSLTLLGGCRGVYGALWLPPKWVAGGVFSVYTGNGHYDGKARWDNWTKNYQSIWNVIDIHFFNYDIRDPYVNAPFFGDPR